MADQKDIGKALEESLRVSKQVNAGNQQQNADLAKSISLLSKINELRDESIAKVKALNRDSINTKEIQKELQKVEAKRQLTAIKMADLEKNMSTAQKNRSVGYIAQIDAIKKKEEEIARAKATGNRVLERQLSRQLTTLDSTLQTMEQTLSFDERKLAAAIQANNVASENAALLQKELDFEKQISKNVGFTGKLMGFFANKLGVGSKYYGEMVEKARDLAEEGKKLSFGDKLGGLAKAAGGGIKEALTDPITLIPIIGGLIGGLVKGIMSFFEFVVESTSKIHEMGRNVGLTRDQAISLNNEFSNFATLSGKAYLNSERLFETYLDISKVLGVNNKISNDNLRTQYELNKFLKVDAETSAEIEKSSKITGRNSRDIAQSIYSQTRNLQKATGVSFNFQQILKEASSLGGVLGLTFAKYPEKLTKSLLATKAMGLELKQLDSMADSFLDFESSVSKEFEAQLITGKNINLAKAREAFLNNDLAKAAEEITKQVGSAAEFTSMRRTEQESLAAAMGMSRDQMADMLKQQEYLSRFGARDVKDLHEKVRLLRLQGKEQEAINLLGDREAYNKMVTATASEDLAGFIEKIKKSFADLVANTGLAEFVTRTIGWLSEPKNIMSIVNRIKDIFATVVGVVGSVVGGIMRFLNMFSFFGINIDESMIEMVESAGTKLKAANLGSLSVGSAAAKDKAGAGGASGPGGEGGSKNYSSPMGTSKTDVTVKVRDRDLFIVSYSGYNEGANVDQQTSTKYSTNPLQTK